MRKLYSLFLVLIASCPVLAGHIPLPDNLPQGHPRLLTNDSEKEGLRHTIETEHWAAEVMRGIRSRIDEYVDRHVEDPEWMPSRLMMYWKSHATDVYIRGGVYSHAEGHAPVPTVRFGSSRGGTAVYARPKLEDITPYMDDTKGVWFHNTQKEGRPLEWGEQANASGIESINEEIMNLGKDAAFVHWLTDEAKYAEFAFALFDTYMAGMYYRNEPVDLNNGHAQTLAGLSTFEVIQERILNELAYLYDFLYPYIKVNYPDKLDIYATTFKKWIDITIKNGVPHNNWNLHQAKFILKVAMVLEDNGAYHDKKGRGYYIDYILNRSSARQWSVTRFTDYGYDASNGIWNECPGYAQRVTRDMMNFIRDYDNTFSQNLLPNIPVMTKAVIVLPQYLFPNGLTTAFGDTYYEPVYTEPCADMIRLARKYGDHESERYFARMFLSINKEGAAVDNQEKLRPEIYSFFTAKPLELDANQEKGSYADYVTQTFYAPNVSWLVQRNGFDVRNGMMISQYGSLGNHMHANGIAMELYGKGFVLGPDSGIGSSYFQAPYLEYYSQFPAHNSVMVDGISSYPEMLSNHPFDLAACYPQPGRTEGYYDGITFSAVDFLEPESRSDQSRLMGIVRTGETTGYYVDVFRSAKQRGGDKFHDYFYHNLGQNLTITDGNGTPLTLVPSEDMAFAGGHQFALDYMWDKRSVRTEEDYRALWRMDMPAGDNIYMALWMKGSPDREVFSIKAPPCKAFRKDGHGIPYNVSNEPFLTIAARQHGEAWSRPFISIFEPYTEGEGSSIISIEGFQPENTGPGFAGVRIVNRSGRTDHIFSSSTDGAVAFDGMIVNARYALIGDGGEDFVLFMGDGVCISARGYTIRAEHKTSAVLECRAGKHYFTCDGPVTIVTPKGKKIRREQTAYGSIKL